MSSLIVPKIMLMLTLIFPHYHITEFIPMESWEACQTIVKLQHSTDSGPFRFQIIVGPVSDLIDPDLRILNPEIQSKCEAYDQDDGNNAH